MRARFLVVSLALVVGLVLALLLPGCVRFDGVVDFRADVLEGKKPLTVQFTLLAQGCIDSCVWSFGDDTFSRERNPVHTYEQGGSYTVVVTVVPCRGEPASARKDDYIQVSSGSGWGAAPPTMWCYYGDDEGHRISRSELVPPFEGQNSGQNEVLGQTIGVPHDFVLIGPTLFWTDQAAQKILATDVAPGGSDDVSTVFTCEAVPFGLAVDGESAQIYWAEDDPGSDFSPPTNYRIMRANVASGAGAERVLLWFAPIRDLDFDAVDRDLYYAGYHAMIEMMSVAPQKYGDYIIARMSVDDESGNIIVSEYGEIAEIAVGESDRKIYWYNSHLDAIRRANLNGSGTETVVSDLPSVADLAIDEKNHRIVWVSYIDGVAIIASAALDGSDIRYRLRNATTAKYTAIAIGPKPAWSSSDVGD